MQDYKSLCAAVTICATLVNIQTQTDRQHFDQLIWIAQTAELKKTNVRTNKLKMRMEWFKYNLMSYLTHWTKNTQHFNEKWLYLRITRKLTIQREKLMIMSQSDSTENWPGLPVCSSCRALLPVSSPTALPCPDTSCTTCRTRLPFSECSSDTTAMHCD